jgi:hypothetical protein
MSDEDRKRLRAHGLVLDVSGTNSNPNIKSQDPIIKLRGEIERLKDTIKYLKKEIKSTIKYKNGVVKEKEELVKENESLMKENESLTTENIDLKAEIKNLHNFSATVQIAWKGENKWLKVKIVELEKENAKLKKKISKKGKKPTFHDALETQEISKPLPKTSSGPVSDVSELSEESGSSNYSVNFGGSMTKKKSRKRKTKRKKSVRKSRKYRR